MLIPSISWTMKGCAVCCPVRVTGNSALRSRLASISMGSPNSLPACQRSLLSAKDSISPGMESPERQTSFAEDEFLSLADWASVLGQVAMTMNKRQKRTSKLLNVTFLKLVWPLLCSGGAIVNSSGRKPRVWSPRSTSPRRGRRKCLRVTRTPPGPAPLCFRPRGFRPELLKTAPPGR